MKAIVLYVREFLGEQWNHLYFLLVGLLLATLFILNYCFGLETPLKKHLAFPIQHIVFYFVLYFVPYMLTHACYAFVKRDYDLFRTARFWILSVFALVVLSIYIALHDGPWYLLKTQPWLFAFTPDQFRPFAARCASNVLPLTLAGIFLVTYWWKVDRNTMPLYGFSAKTINLKPYFFILLFLTPLVVAVSFTPDFQLAYPRFKFGFPNQLVGGERHALIGLFDLCYGADFVFVEFFFRGFLILAFMRMLGSRAIIPMVVVYALIHFEKPLLEALSSIAGGLVLGVVSYRTKSIYGGIILHLGIAFLMEIAGAMQIVTKIN